MINKFAEEARDQLLYGAPSYPDITLALLAIAEELHRLNEKTPVSTAFDINDFGLEGDQ